MKIVLKRYPGLYLLLLLPLFLLASNCTHEAQFIDELDNVCFQDEILPVLQASCGGCHAVPGHETNFSTTDYNSVIQIVKPGNARESELYRVITAINSEHMMPPDRPLSKEQRSLIMIWIEQGALNLDCTQDTIPNPPSVPQDDTVCFTQLIQPLLVSSCATTDCHDAVTSRDGYNLTTYAQIMSGEEGVVPFNPTQSKIYKVLFESGEDRMPPQPRTPLTEGQKELIRKWIADGALNSDCPDAGCDTLNEISFSADVFPVINLSCTGCHNSASSSGGVNLSDYSSISNVASTKVNGVSLLSGVIRKLPGFKPMPPSGSLDNCDIRKIELWMEQGMKNN